MALIQFPSLATIVEVNLEFRVPGQTRLRSIYDGSEQVLTRGPGRFGGSVTLATTDAASAAERADIERFLVEVGGFENTFQVPIQRASRSGLTAGANVRFNSSSVTGAGYLRLQSILGAGSFSYEFPSGDYVSMGGRLYICVASGNLFLPAIVPSDNTIGWENPYVTARLGGDNVEAIPNALNADFGGPWVIPFEEAVT